MLRREFLEATVAGTGLIGQIKTESLSPLDQFAMAYFQHVNNYVQCKSNPEPDERLMRGIENRLDIPEQGADDFRRSLMSKIGGLYLEGKPLRWNSVVWESSPCPNEVGEAIKKEFEAWMMSDTQSAQS